VAATGDAVARLEKSLRPLLNFATSPSSETSVVAVKYVYPRFWALWKSASATSGCRPLRPGGSP
jgi:hypothetical protein